MKKTLSILLFAVAALSAGCFKSVSFNTDYVLKPLAEISSGDVPVPFAEDEVQAFAYAVDTSLWTVSTYDDALAGIITQRDDPSVRLTTPLVVADSVLGEDGLRLTMRLKESSIMVVAVDTKDKLYGYTQQEVPENFPTLYVTVIFQPWKSGLQYKGEKGGSWIFRNDFYVPPTILDCYIDPSVQSEEGGETVEPTKLKAYAFAADTTLWSVTSYLDAAAGVITFKTDTTVTRSNVDFTAYKEASGNYGMEVSSSPLLVVVVDQTDEIYAYSKQVVDLNGSPVTFPVVFRPWREEYLYEDAGWVYVNEKFAPKEKTLSVRLR